MSASSNSVYVQRRGYRIGCRFAACHDSKYFRFYQILNFNRSGLRMSCFFLFLASSNQFLTTFYSSSLTECGPTDYSAPKPCFFLWIRPEVILYAQSYSYLVLVNLSGTRIFINSFRSVWDITVVSSSWFQTDWQILMQ